VRVSRDQETICSSQYRLEYYWWDGGIERIGVMGRKSCFEIVGKTEDGKQVVAGLFKANDTFGLPLEASLMLLKDNNMIADVLDYFGSARKAGWNFDRTKIRFMEAVLGTYGPEFWEGIERGLVRLRIEENWQ